MLCVYTACGSQLTCSVFAFTESVCRQETITSLSHLLSAPPPHTHFPLFVEVLKWGLKRRGLLCLETMLAAGVEKFVFGEWLFLWQAVEDLVVILTAS